MWTFVVIVQALKRHTSATSAAGPIPADADGFSEPSEACHPTPNNERAAMGNVLVT